VVPQQKTQVKSPVNRALDLPRFDLNETKGPTGNPANGQKLKPEQSIEPNGNKQMEVKGRQLGVLDQAKLLWSTRRELLQSEFNYRSASEFWNDYLNDKITHPDIDRREQRLEVRTPKRS
jgi:hypothetical protein